MGTNRAADGDFNQMCCMHTWIHNKLKFASLGACFHVPPFPIFLKYCFVELIPA